MITQEQFEVFEDIRDSGITNMFNVRRVCELSGGVLDWEDCMEIIKNYSELKNKFMPEGKP